MSLRHHKFLRNRHDSSCIFLECAWGDQHVISEECLGCKDFTDYYHGYTLPCKDVMCQWCFCKLLEMAIKKEGSYPPRCCGKEVDPAKITSFGRSPLEKDIIERYKKKQEKSSVQIRTYCSAPTCGALILPHPVLRGQNARCGRCGSSTCILCKKASHIGKKCSWDVAEVEFLAEAQENGWKKWPKCSIWIGRIEGCNDMQYGTHPHPDSSLMIDNLQVY